MQDELKAVRQIARKAGAILLKYFAETTSVEWKAPGDPVTIADREASELIVTELRKLFPSDGILSEEMPDDPGRLNRTRVWMIDPMDGTREFIARRQDFSVMIGLISEGIPVLGVVYQPCTDKLYSAAKGIGAVLEHEGQSHVLQVSPEEDASQMTIAMSRSHRSARVDELAHRLRIRREIRIGSVGLKVGLICEGAAHLYVHLGTHTQIWDTCAPEAILFEAGGELTDVDGNRLDYTRRQLQNPNGVIASNGRIHERAIRIANQVMLNRT
jgi:3'(2'), 5'-bisphosphate nucleotidase